MALGLRTGAEPKRSTGFEDTEGPFPDLSNDYADLRAAAVPHYNKLAAPNNWWPLPRVAKAVQSSRHRNRLQISSCHSPPLAVQVPEPTKTFR